MNVLSLSGVAVVSVSLLCSSASVVTVIDLGPILNDSISLPNTSDTKTAGKGESFSDYPGRNYHPRGDSFTTRGRWAGCGRRHLQFFG